MKFLKLFISLTLTILFIWALNSPWNIGKAAHEQEQEDGSSKLINSTEKFVPPIGKLLSPSHGFWQNAEGNSPALSTGISAAVLTAPVQVYYDDRMVPHIFADNTEDAIFAQGYVTASLRLWQMELQTHAAAGRLTEILGLSQKMRNVLIPKDRHTRKIGIPLAAEKAVEQWKKTAEFKYIKAYSEGVNHYIQSLSYANLPLMYKLLDYEPEEWSPLKCALLLKSMGRTLTDRDHDFELTNVLQNLGLEKYNQLYPSYFAEQSPVILDSMKIQNPILVETKTLHFHIDPTHRDSLATDFAPKGIGSNNWVVSGNKTASGNPILCNDPHLLLNLPSLWFEIQIHTPDFNSYGASLPGAPAILSGFNENIAWGVTNVSHDVKDWYAIRWKDESKQMYWFDSSYHKASYRIEEIKVRGEESVFDTLIMTHIGPISYQEDGQDFALRWTLHDASEEPITFLKLLKAKNYEDYKDALLHFACPAQNIVFAAKNGDIALWVQGKIPIRQPNQGKFVQKGESSNDLWQGFIPQNHLPHEYNPIRGFVGSANQHSIAPNLYPYSYYGYFEEYRGRYLNRQLAAMDSIGIKDMMALQYDSYSLKAEDFMFFLHQYLQTGKMSKSELEIWHQLKKWNYQYMYNQIEPVIFETWFNSLHSLVYDELIALNQNIKLPNQYQLLQLLKRDSSNIILDIKATPKRENIKDLITISFQKSCQAIPREANGQIKKWGDLRGSKIVHLSKQSLFSANQITADGHVSALNALSGRGGPSWRMIVEMGENIDAYGIYPGGQSENPGSRYYDNMIEKWSKGEYFPLLFMQQKQDYQDKIIFQQDFDK